MRRSGRRSAAGKASARVTFFWSGLFDGYDWRVDAGRIGRLYGVGIAPTFAHFDKFLVVGWCSRNSGVASEVGRIASQHHRLMGRHANSPEH